MTALIVVDVQKDFLPGGALAVTDGDVIVPRINELLKLPFDHIVATKDWHPPNHSSFAANQGKLVGEVILLRGIKQIMWPVHCVQGTKGAEFSPLLDQSLFKRTFYKGVDAAIDSYSGFYDNNHKQSTGLGEYLNQQQVKRVFLAGLTTDYCVKYSALDALEQGYETYVVIDCCKGIDVHADDCANAVDEMRKSGAHIVTSAELRRQQNQLLAH